MSRAITEEITKEELLEQLDDKWRAMIPGIDERKYWDSIVEGINESIENKHFVMPGLNKIFAALNDIDLSSFRVLMIGQDPYPTPGMATGHAFSVKDGKFIPASLKNIFAEIDRCYDSTLATDRQTEGDLSLWTEQGVLLLNSVLTIGVGRYQHLSIGWKNFTNEIVSYLDKNYTFVTIALGSDAQKVADRLERNEHLVVKAGHPSPLNTTHPFLGCDCFVRCNKLLRANKLLPIRWT